MTCKAVESRLPSLDDPDDLRGMLAAHAGSCLRCQAEIARHRRLRRSLGGLADRVEAAPIDLVALVTARIVQGAEPPAMPLSRRTRVAAAAGAVVAAAGTVAVVRWVRARSAA